MYIPNPILLDKTPADGLTLPISPERGGLAGYILLGQLGPPADVEVSGNGGATWQAVTYPRTLTAGEMLRLTRADGDTLTVLRALAPVDEAGPPEPETPAAEPYAVITDDEGYQSITNAAATTDAEGYQIIPDGAATADGEGFETVERSE